jgi:hypothetical protein
VVGIDRPERAGDRAHFAAYAHGVHYHLGAGAGIDLDRLDGTSVETPGFGALRTGIGNFPAFVVEIENLDARWARLNRPVFSYEQAISHCKQPVHLSGSMRKDFCMTSPPLSDR